MSAGLVLLLVFGHSRVGWLLTACGPARVLVGIARDPLGYFEPTRLVDSVLWIVLLLASVGLVAWSLTRRPA